MMLWVALFVALTACGTSTSGTITSMAISAGKNTLAPNETTTILASVAGDGDFDRTVTFSMVSGDGAIAPTGGLSCTFTAGANAGTSVVRATSVADGSKSIDVTFTVAPAGGLTVAISSPSADASTKATIPIQVAVAGEPDTVELLRDGELLLTLTAPYTYTWDTSAEPEKTYALTARATKNGLAPVTSAPRKIKVDRSGPKLASQTPAGGDGNAFLGGEISATFDEALAPSSVTTSSAKLLAGANAIAATVTLSQDGTKVTFVPTATPTLPASLTMSFTGVTDALGNAVNVTSGAFTAPEWQSPGTQPLDLTLAHDAISRSIALDKSGNPVVAFEESDGTQRNVYVKAWNGTAWTQLGGALDVSLSVDASIPALALDGAGNPIVAWTEGSGLGPLLLYVKAWNGSAWTPLGASLNVNGAFSASGVSIALDASGKPFVAWAEYDSVNLNTDVFVKTWNGSSWVAVGAGPLDLVQNEDANAPSIQVDGAGLPVVAFGEFDGSSGNIVVERWNGSSWAQVGGSPDVSLAAPAESANLALESNGTPVVAWEESGNVYVARWSGSAWSLIGGALDVVPAHLTAAPRVRLTANGAPVVTWAESDGASLDVWVKRWNGSSWVLVGSTSLDVFQAKSAEAPQLALDAKGNPFVAFAETDGTSLNVYVKRWNRIP